MPYVIIDIENSGLFDFKKPADAHGQPRLAELAMIYADDDLNFQKTYQSYIRPNGWTISPEVSAVNKLTDEFLNEHGRPIDEVLQIFHNAIEEGRIVIAFNAQFDLKQLRAESRLAGLDDMFERTKNICAMRASTDVCCIPYATGRKGNKFPKLAEACKFFGIEQSGEHSALADAMSCFEIAQKLHEQGKLPPAQVHFAKETLDNAEQRKPLI